MRWRPVDTTDPRGSLSQPRTIMGAVRIFVGSLMGGAFCPFREAASGDIAMLGDQPARAEDCPVSPTSARVARLAGVRSADVVALILGSQYGRTREATEPRTPAGDNGLSRSRPDRSSLVPTHP